MKRTLMLLAAAAGFALARPALAADDADTSTKADDAARTAPTPPTLPATASERATFVHENIAFGKKGEEESAEHRHQRTAKTADQDRDQAKTADRDRDQAKTADRDRDRAKTADRERAQEEVHEALAEKAEIPAKAPTLPSTASERASFVHENIAFGKKGEAERAAHAQSDKQGRSDADDARADMANRAAHGAAEASGSMNQDGHAAANQERERHMRQMGPSGSSPTTMPSMPKGGR